VRLIAPGLPGDVADLFARMYGEWLELRLDQPSIIENRAGAGGNIANRSSNARPARWLHAALGYFGERMECHALRHAYF
jgi:tripartite-type tricarboxylate transporter receptor subunit TctC